MPSPRIFRNRWFALLWAGGILWTAYGVADSAPHKTESNTTATEDATGATVDASDLAVLANAIAN